MIVVEGDVNILGIFGEFAHAVGYFVDLLVRIVIVETLRDASTRDIGPRIPPVEAQVSELGIRNLIFCLHDREVLTLRRVDQNQGQLPASKELQGGLPMSIGKPVAVAEFNGQTPITQ